MKKLLPVLLAFPSLLAAQSTYTAAGCSQAQVQAAYTAEQVSPVDGDIIAIPACSATWSGSQVNMPFSNSVTIQGAGAISATTGGASTTGTDQTVITDAIASGSMWTITTTAGKSLRFTGIAILGASTSAANGVLNISGNSASVRVDHCHFLITATSSVGLFIGGSVQGVADHIYFDSGAGGFVDNPIAMHNGQGWNGGNSGDFGDSSWADVDNFGTSKFFFFEDSRWSNADIGDGHDGARYVLRYSTYSGDHGQMYNHGLTNSRGRSMRAAEVYQMTFTRSPTGGSPSFSNNGGSLLYWGNTTIGVRFLVGIDYTRKDNTTYGYGTTPSGWGNCNGAGTSTAWDVSSTGPCLDQPARGKGDLLNGPVTFPSIVNTRTGTIAATNQALVPIYVWNNTYNDAGFSPEGCVTNGVSALMSEDRDFYQQFTATFCKAGSFNGTAGVGQGLLSARPGTCTTNVAYWATDTQTLYQCGPTNTWSSYYTPYTYPHPLQGAAAPIATFTPASLNFGQVPVNMTSNPLSVTLQNTGTANLVNTNIALTNSKYSIQNNTCGTPATITQFTGTTSGFTLTPGSTCTFQVIFTPPGVQVWGGGVAFFDNTGVLGGDLLIFSGTGTGPPAPATNLFAKAK